MKLGDGLTLSQKKEVGKLLIEYQDIFSDMLETTNLVQHKFEEMTTEEPIQSELYHAKQL